MHKANDKSLNEENNITLERDMNLLAVDQDKRQWRKATLESNHNKENYITLEPDMNLLTGE